VTNRREDALTQAGGATTDVDISPAPLDPPGSDTVAAEGRSRRSRLLWEVDHWAGRPLTALGVLAASAAWVLLSVISGFPGRWEQIFQSLVAAITVTMVFVIQHTQARHQAATQRKLDEILKALPGADNALITLEHASDSELRATRHQHRQVRQAALNRPRGSGNGNPAPGTGPSGVP
jgi:low affinity Fe/Cu permease